MGRNSFRKEFDDMPLQLGSIACGAFEGEFSVEDGAITDIVLDGDKWDFDDKGHYVKTKAIVILSESHWLWQPLCAALEDAYRDEIEATDPDQYDQSEHALGTYEAGIRAASK